MTKTTHLVQRFELFFAPEDAEPLKGRCVYELLDAMTGYYETFEAYGRLDEQFVQQVNDLHTVDLRTLTREQQQVAIRYALWKARCDCIEAWLPQMEGKHQSEQDGESLWLTDRFVYSEQLLPVLGALLETGRANRRAIRDMIQSPEVWQYVVRHIWCPLVEVTYGHEPREFWQYCVDNLGAHVLDDPALLYRALTQMHHNNAVVIWEYTADKELALSYEGEIGTVRELFSLRHIYGLEGLLPPPSDDPLLADFFRGSRAVSDEAKALASAISEELAAHVRFAFRRGYDPLDNCQCLSDYLIGSGPVLHEQFAERLAIAPIREVRYALLAAHNSRRMSRPDLALHALVQRLKALTA